jgi:predicted ATPase/DNA-binding winged helix-turn-helix (wHTH) protein
MAESETDPGAGAMRFGPYRLLRSQRLLLDGARPVPIGSRAMDILLALIEQPGRTLSRDDLIARAWPDTTVDEVNLRVHVSALRRALGDAKDGQRYLVTIPGRGYRFVGALASETMPLLPATRARTRPATLPLPLARIIGRDEVIERIRTLLPKRRFITIVGPGGMGKTTVATSVADGIDSNYPDGVQWVDLSPLERDETVPAALAFALGLVNISIDPSDGIIGSLRGKELLLVLDCCERVVDGAARMAELVRHNAPGVHILATSREPLRVRGENILQLPPLRLPRETDDLTVAQAMQYPAIRLFVERASATMDGFTLNEANVPLVARICARLDGIALAIELAAGHLTAFELQGLADLLDDRFRLMATGRRTALPRHRTMQATLDWSYETLPEPERLLLRRLAVFGGSADLEAISAIVADATLSGDAALGCLVSLVDKSLVAAEFTDAEARYRLLDITRAYALDKLIAGGELPALSRRHAEYYLQLLRTSSDGEALTALTADLANIRAALDRAASAGGDPSLSVALTIAAVPLWMQLSLLGECRSRVNAALLAFDPTAEDAPFGEMALRAALGMSLMYTRGPIDETEAIWVRVLELAESIGNTEYQLRALYGLWLYRVLICQYRAALELAQRFCGVAERGAATADIATAERLRAMALHYLGDQRATRDCALRSLAAPPPANRQFHTTHYSVDQRVGAFVLLSRSLWLLGQPDQAMQAAQDGVDEAIAVGHANSLCIALADAAGLVAILNDDRDKAENFAAMLTRHADQHGLDVWRTYAKALRGRLLMNRDDDAGAALLRSALADLRGTPFDIRFELYLVWLAEILSAARQTSEALAAISEAHARAERTEERWYLPELLRLRGELLLQEGDADAAAELFARSLHEAQDQAAASWELRTATSVARSQPGRRALLKSVLDRFGEGFATADVSAAQRLLAELAD